jgi:Domain of unknown function (DUF4145)
MSIHREIWKVPFRVDGSHYWKCPICHLGMLDLEPNDFFKYETVLSQQSRHFEDWEPHWISYHFIAAFKCSNKNCEEVVTCTGLGTVEESTEYDDEENPSLMQEDVFSPLYFSVPLRVFEVPIYCPDEVSSEITKSFAVFFADPASSANHLRTSIEELLTFLRIKRYERINGELRTISLHKRIKIYENTNKSIADKLLAIKWLGNAASHPGGLTRDDVLDAYEIMESTLTSLFLTGQKRLEKLVKTVNRRKGPTHKK